LGLGFLVDDIKMGVGFVFFWMTSLVDPTRRFFVSKLLWILRSNTSL